MTTHGSKDRTLQTATTPRKRWQALVLGTSFLLMTGAMAAQAPAADASKTGETQPTQYGYIVHHTADLGGHTGAVSGSGAMYDTLVNLHTGPRVLGETFTLHAAPGTKHLLFDSLDVWSNGFGGDPVNVAKMSVSKAKIYEFSGIFRRDRQYFDYDLFGNPNLPSNLFVPIGNVSAPTATFTIPQANQSPELMNTVRRMTDLQLTIKPISEVTYRLGYSKNIFQGPSLSPSYTIGKNDALLAQFLRHSSDDYFFGLEWKPGQQTRVGFEERVTHYKNDTYYTLAPQAFWFQESDGTPVAPGAWDSLAGYGISSCNTASMGSAYVSATNYTILTPAMTPGGKPVINPACDVLTSEYRSGPIRTTIPTELVKFQSSSIRNIAMNGQFHFTEARMNMDHYYEQWNGLAASGARQATFLANSTGQRREVGFDYNLTWNVAKAWQLSDTVDYSNQHQPGVATATESGYNTPAAPNQSIYYSGTLTATTNAIAISNYTSKNGVPVYAFFGQRLLTNNATVQWEPNGKVTTSLTYRYRTHRIIEDTTMDPVNIDEHAGVLTAAYRPSKDFEANGSVEIGYFNDAFTPWEPRQLKVYRVHTRYRPASWASVNASYTDRERHNNTLTPGDSAAAGSLLHRDYNRVASFSFVAAPNEKYSFDVNYTWTRLFATTNICYSSGAAPASLTQPIVPGTAVLNAAGAPAICPARTTQWGPVANFMDAPTQFASIGATYNASKKLKTRVGYQINAVSGNQFFTDARAVQGSLQSAYQTPYLNVAYAIRPSWIWKAEYNFFGYGEGGVSGATLCSTTTSTTATVVPCSTLANTARTMSPAGATLPRNFHANIVTLSMHYEF